MKRHYLKKGEYGENLQVTFDTETKETIIREIIETKESLIRKAELLNIEDIRKLLLELFK